MKSVSFAFVESGWRLQVSIGGNDSWIGIVGPQGQLAAFECPSDSVRSIVLSQLADELIASESNPEAAK